MDFNLYFCLFFFFIVPSAIYFSLVYVASGDRTVAYENFALEGIMSESDSDSEVVTRKIKVKVGEGARDH